MCLLRLAHWFPSLIQFSGFVNTCPTEHILAYNGCHGHNGKNKKCPMWLVFGGVYDILYNPYHCIHAESTKLLFVICIQRAPPLITPHYFSSSPVYLQACWLEPSIIDLTTWKLCRNNTNDSSSVEIKVVMHCCC